MPLVDRPSTEKIRIQYTEARVKELQVAFEKHQEDERGVPLSMIGTVMRSLGDNPTKADIKSYLTQGADEDDDLFISFREFLTMYSRNGGLKDNDDENDLIECFAKFDKTGTGKISQQEFRRIMTTLGEPMEDDEFGQMLAAADIDAEGNIDYKKFVKIMVEPDK